MFRLKLIVVLLSLLIEATISLRCQTEAAQKPLQLSENLALLAGDVVTFRTNVGSGRVGFLAPLVRGNNLDNECATISLTSTTTDSAATQFLVVPVAVVDPDSFEQPTSVNNNGNTPPSASSMSMPRLVSTVQLVHVESGRLLGTKTCVNPIQDNTQAVCNPFTPVLLPRSMNYPCDAVWGDFHTIWDLDAHDIPSESYASLLRNKTGIEQRNTSSVVRVDSIPVVFPTSNNTATAHSGFSIFHVDNNNNVDDSFNTTNAEEEDEDLFLGDSIANDIGAPPMSRPTCDAHHYADELRPFSVFSLSSHIERQNKAKRIQKLLEMSESELDAHASTEEGRIDLELWLSMENPEAKNSNSTCRADAQRYNAASARHDMISQGIRAHYGIFEEMADLYYADAETLPRKLERIRGNPESALGNSHRSSSTLGSRKHGQKKMRTLSDDESQQLATELLRSERWQSLEQAVSAPETKFSNVWDRIQGNTPARRRAALLQRIQERLRSQQDNTNDENKDGSLSGQRNGKMTPSSVASSRGVQVHSGHVAQATSNDAGGGEMRGAEAGFQSMDGAKEGVKAPESRGKGYESGYGDSGNDDSGSGMNISGDVSLADLTRSLQKEEVEEVVLWTLLATVDVKLYGNITDEKLRKRVPEEKIPGYGISGNSKGRMPSKIRPGKTEIGNSFMSGTSTKNPGIIRSIENAPSSIPGSFRERYEKNVEASLSTSVAGKSENHTLFAKRTRNPRLQVLMQQELRGFKDALQFLVANEHAKVLETMNETRKTDRNVTQEGKSAEIRQETPAAAGNTTLGEEISASVTRATAVAMSQLSASMSEREQLLLVKLMVLDHLRKRAKSRKGVKSRAGTNNKGNMRGGGNDGKSGTASLSGFGSLLGSLGNLLTGKGSGLSGNSSTSHQISGENGLGKIIEGMLTPNSGKDSTISPSTTTTDKAADTNTATPATAAASTATITSPAVDPEENADITVISARGGLSKAQLRLLQGLLQQASQREKVGSRARSGHAPTLDDNLYNLSSSNATTAIAQNSMDPSSNTVPTWSPSSLASTSASSRLQTRVGGIPVVPVTGIGGAMSNQAASALNSTVSSLPFVNEVPSTLSDFGLGAFMSGITATPVGNALSGKTVGFSLEDLAGDAASWATQNMLNMDASNVFNSETDARMQRMQERFLNSYLSTLQMQTVTNQKTLSSIAFANNYVNNTAFISLRIRPLGAGPVELVTPCSSYITEEYRDPEPSENHQSASPFNQKRQDSVASVGGKRGVYESGQEDGGAYHASDTLWRRPAQFADRMRRDPSLYRYNPAKFERRPLGKNKIFHVPDDTKLTFRNEDGEIVQEKSDSVHRPLITYTGRFRPDSVIKHSTPIDLLRGARTCAEGDRSCARSGSAGDVKGEEDEDEDDHGNVHEFVQFSDADASAYAQPIENKEGLQTFVKKKGVQITSGKRQPQKKKSLSISQKKQQRVFHRYGNTGPFDRFHNVHNRNARKHSASDEHMQDAGHASQALNNHRRGMTLGHRLANSREYELESVNDAAMRGERGHVEIIHNILSMLRDKMTAERGPGGPRKHTLGVSEKERRSRKWDIPIISRPYSSISQRRVYRHIYSMPASLSDGVTAPRTRTTDVFGGTHPESGSSSGERHVFARDERETPSIDLSNRHILKAFQTLNTATQPCVLRSVPHIVAGIDTGESIIECVPVSSSCPTPTALESSSLWAITRVPFSDVPTSSLFLSESMTNLNYDMDFASVNTYPFVIGQMALRNFSPFEQFLTAKAAKRLFQSYTFTWAVEIRPIVGVVFGDIPSIITQPIAGVLNALLAPILNILDMIIPGISALIPPVTIPSFGLDTVGVEVPIGWRGSQTHTEDSEVVVSYSITAPPQSHIIGRAIAHMGRTSIPFSMDVSRSVHVPAGVFGQTTGQVINYDYRVPGIYEGANLVNTEFIVDAL